MFRMDVGCGKGCFWSETMVFCEGRVRLRERMSF